MISVEVSIKLNEEITSGLTGITNVLNSMINAFQGIQSNSEFDINTDSLDLTREHINGIAIAAQDMQVQSEQEINPIEEPVKFDYDVESSIELFDIENLKWVSDEVQSIESIIERISKNINQIINQVAENKVQISCDNSDSTETSSSGAEVPSSNAKRIDDLKYEMDFIELMTEDITKAQEQISKKALEMNLLPPDIDLFLDFANEGILELIENISNIQAQDISMLDDESISRLNAEYEEMQTNLDNVITIQEQVNLAIDETDMSVLTDRCYDLNDALGEVESNVRVNLETLQESQANFEIEQPNAVDLGNTEIISPNSLNDLDTANIQLEVLRVRVLDIQNNPLDTIGADIASVELERLGTQIKITSSQQEDLNNAMQDMAMPEITAEYENLSESISNAGENISENADKQSIFNKFIEEGQKLAEKLGSKIKDSVTELFKLDNIKENISKSLELANVQITAETQLKQVLDNSGASEGSYERLEQTSKNIQSRGMYSDEAMLNGAIEFQNHTNDVGTTEVMMESLANYAAATSGNAEVTSEQMVGYTEKLCKAMEGSEAALQDLGLNLDEEALNTINSLGEMERASYVADLISQKFDGMYDAMSNTPEGKITQIKGAITGIREEVGIMLYSAIEPLLDVVIENMPQIQEIIETILMAIQPLIESVGAILFPIIETVIGFIIENMPVIEQIIGVISIAIEFMTSLIEKVIEAATEVYNFFVDNWSQIAPIVWGVVAALAILILAFAVYKVVMLLVTIAQAIYNAVLLMCPLTWIVIIIGVLIVLLYVVVSRINAARDTTISATGIISALIAGLAAFIYNRFAFVWNIIADLVNFFYNCFNDPVAAVKILFLDLAQSVVGYMTSMAGVIQSIINTIPKVNIDITSGLDSFKDDLASLSQDIKDESEWVEVVQKLEYKDVDEKMHNAYDKTEAFEDKIGNMIGGAKDFIANLGSEDAFNLNNGGEGALNQDINQGFSPGFDDSISGNIDNISGNTDSIDKTVSLGEDDIKYMRDIAEKEAINRFTTADLTVNFSSQNEINSDMDLDGVVSYLEDKVAETLLNTAEGVHI